MNKFTQFDLCGLLDYPFEDKHINNLNVLK